MAALHRWCSIWCVALLAACGGKSLDDGGDTGGSDSGGSAAAGTSHGGSGQGGSGTAGTEAGGSDVGGTGVGGSEACSAYDDQAPVPVHIRMINQTARPLHFGQLSDNCSVEPLFEVAGDKLGRLPAVSDCPGSCRSLREQGVAGCPAICRIPQTITLAPGEVHELDWNGLYAVQGELPASCLPFDNNEQPQSCQQAKRITPDLFTFRATAGETRECPRSSSDCGPCQPDAGGGCATNGTLIGGKMLSATASLAMDESYGLYPEAADAAPGAGAAPSGALNEAYVELVFSE